MKRFIAEAATVATLAALPGSVPPAPEHRAIVPIDAQVIETAAHRAVAGRFIGGCAISEVVDTGQKPPSRLPGMDNRPHTTVNVGLRLTDTPPAEWAMQRYKDDSAVEWGPLVAGARVVLTNRQGRALPLLPVVEPRAIWIKEPDAQDKSSKTVYPATNYPEGTKAVVTVTNEVSSRDDKAKAFIMTTTEVACGSIVLKNVDGAPKWVAAAPGEEFPAVDVVEETKVYR